MSEVVLKEIPDNWVMGKVQDLITIRNGYAFKGKDFQDEVGAPVIRQTNLSTDVVNFKKPKYLPLSFLDEHPGYRVVKGDVLIGLSGSIGNLSRYVEDQPALQNQRTGLLLEQVPGATKFVQYYLQLIKKDLLDAAKGVAVQNISSKAIENWAMPIAPPEQQKRIVAKIEELFSHIDAGIVALKKSKQLLKQYRQSVLKAAVTGELTKQWREDNKDKLEPASQLLERILQERRQKWETKQLEQFKAKGKVPKDDGWKGKYKEPDALDVIPSEALPGTWQWSALGQVFEVFVGATPSRKKLEYWGGDINWVSSGEVAFCRIKNTKEKITEEGLNNTSTALHPPGTVMLGMIGEGKTRGQAAILDIYAAHNQNTSAIEKCVEEQSTEFLYFYLMQQYELTRKRGSGNNQKALNKTRVQAIEFPLAPIGEQKIISELLSDKFTSIERMEDAIEIQLRKAEKNKQSILSSAFSGRLTAR